MKNKLLFVVLSLISIVGKSQVRYSSEWYAKISVGYNVLDPVGKGYFYKAGAEYKPLKKWRVALHFTHGEVDTYDKNFTHDYYFPADTARYFAKYRGITRSEWFNGKGSFLYWTANTLSIQIGYDIYFKKNHRFFLSPKFGLSRINSKYYSTHLVAAAFHNNILTGGILATEVRFSRMWGVNYGGDINYNITKRHCLFIDIDKIADMARWEDKEPGSFTGKHYYNAWNLGVGYRYKIK
ncbi:hypothetical protein ACQ33O_08670 [Ferruginibacter sp. SUN002]|uniref:hypothetical protein n=1 Tax=Ferruginibacter sp. SUN002 TaxID=2937789 RepID=UPI003D3661E1